MIAVEVLAGMLTAALAVAMTYAAVVGGLGVLGVVRFVRCDRCGRLGLTTPAQPLRSCAHCRHGWLLHPLYRLHHARPEGPGVRAVRAGGRR